MMKKYASLCIKFVSLQAYLIGHQNNEGYC